MGKLAKVTDVQGSATIQQVLNASATDWDVQKWEAGVFGAGSEKVGSGGFTALVRPDTCTPLAYVGSRFRANSHRQQLYTLEPFVQSGDILPVSVSMWDNGAVLAYQFRCPGLDVTIRDSDIVSPLLTLAFAYGSQLADSAFFADFRWFCKNQMGQVASLNRDHRVKHRGGIVDRFGDVLGARMKELSGELSGRYDGMRRMTQAPLEGKALQEYFGQCVGCTPEEITQAWVTPHDELRGKGSKIPDILDCYEVDDAGAEGTVWQAYNAVTRYETHKDGRSAETRQRRMLLGAGSSVANQAWELGVKLAA